MSWSDVTYTNAGNELASAIGGQTVLWRARGYENTSSEAAEPSGFSRDMNVINCWKEKDTFGVWRQVFTLQMTNIGLTHGFVLRRMCLFAVIDGAETLTAVIDNPVGDEIPGETDSPGFRLDHTAATKFAVTSGRFDISTRGFYNPLDKKLELDSFKAQLKQELWDELSKFAPSHGLRVFTTPGVYSWTPPAIGTYIVELRGGGNSLTYGYPGGYGKKACAVTSLEPITVTVGGVGAASSFGSFMTATAGGAPGSSSQTGTNATGSSGTAIGADLEIRAGTYIQATNAITNRWSNLPYSSVWGGYQGSYGERTGQSGWDSVQTAEQVAPPFGCGGVKQGGICVIQW